MEATAAESLAVFRKQLLRRLPAPGRRDFAELGGLSLVRHDAVTSGTTCLYRPVAALVVQGRKRSVICGRENSYGEGQSMVVGVDLPGVFHVVEAAPERPFLCAAISLDFYVITGLLSEMPFTTPPATHPVPVIVSQAQPDLISAFTRLTELADRPERIPVLAPMILKEIHFYLLSGPQGDCLHLFGSAGTQAHRIASALAWLREHYAQPLHIEELAEMAHMAPSTFHRHFRAVTGVSPLQFQKRLRLHEAERLMLAEGMDAGAAAFAVGYAGASQFSREYKRQFGAPPRRDVTRKRS